MQINNPHKLDEPTSYNLTPGKWDFTVLELSEGRSKSKGDPQVNGKIKATDDNGNSSNIFIHLPLAGKSLAHFCRAIGAYEEYCSGELSLENYIGASGECTGEMIQSPDYPARPQVKFWSSTSRNKDIPF